MQRKFLMLLIVSFLSIPLVANSYQYYEDSWDRPSYTYPQKYTHYSQSSKKHYKHKRSSSKSSRSYSMPSKIAAPGEKVIIVNPNIHAFGAYSADGTLLRSGTATSGGHYCPDVRRGCRTKAGTFRIFSLGSKGCKSSKYPLPRGGAPMPYCMYFNKNQALHGSYNVVRGNVSHGCVRLHVPDAAWIRFNFAHVGTKVIIKPY